MSKIKDMLLDFNPWWKEEFKVAFKEREVHEQLKKFMPLPQIIAITGLRRVGKTTIMYKSAEDSIKEGMDPKNVIYFSFDEFKEGEIKDVIREYEEIMEKDMRKGKYLLLLDEIQKLDDWENKLKAVYDLFHKNVKVIISGSESLFIRKKSRETLAGRIFEFKVEPLSFREFLGFKGITPEPRGLYEKELSGVFQEFVLSLGLPELVGIRDKDVIGKYVKESLIEKVVYRDIPKLFKVRDTSTIASLLNILTEEPGQVIEISGLAKELNVSRQTISSYLTYLEDSLLVRKLYNFSKNRRKVERKLKKYYPVIISPSLLFKEDILSKSKVFEWLLVCQLKAEFFWRDPYKNEVDMVIANDRLTPIEIKYGEISYTGLLAFMEKFKIDKGYIISKDREEKHKVGKKEIFVVPAFKFLLDPPIV